MVDLLITGGTVVDGSGVPGHPGAVAVEGDRLRMVEGPAPDAGRTIDATGMVVAPGFIDLHSHSGLMILADPLHEPKVRQGVTTEVIGVDGLSYAPMPSAADLHDLVEMNAGLDGQPEIAYDWEVESYLGRLDALHPSLNLAFLVGNSALRLAAIGWDEVEAGAKDVANMRAILREAMGAGALGVSSGLDYPPGAYATTDELASLAAEAGRNGGFYHTHVRYALGDRYLDPFREAIEIGRRGAGPGASPTSTTGRPSRAARSRCWRWSTTRAPRPRRHLRHVSLRVGKHPAPDHDSTLGPGRGTDANEVSPLGHGRAQPHPPGAG